jgi:arylsulfatase A-like enzyme
MRLILAIVLGGLLAALGACTPSVDPIIATDPPRRIVLVTIDTLRADHLESYGYPRDTAPFLTELARSGVVFANAFTASSHTAPSHASLFTSLFPFQHGLLRNGEHLDRDLDTLAERLRDEGYTTAAFASVRFLRGTSDGFATVDAEEEMEGFYRTGAKTIARAIKWVTERTPDERFLLWVHLYDVHQWEGKRGEYKQSRALVASQSTWPRQRLAAFLQRRHGTDRQYFRQRRENMMDEIDEYDGRIRYVDDQLRRLYDTLRSRALPGEELWIVTADHGEGLGSHSFGGHGRYLHREQLRVPLIVHFSDKRYARREVDSLVRHVDIQPTILDLVSGPTGKAVRAGEGYSLLPLLRSTAETFPVTVSFAQRRPLDRARRRQGWSEGEVYSVHDLRFKYIYRSTADHEFYNLRKDPLEANNLVADSNPAKDRLAEHLEARYLSAPELAGEQPPERIAPQHLAELRALGYID